MRRSRIVAFFKVSICSVFLPRPAFGYIKEKATAIVIVHTGPERGGPIAPLILAESKSAETSARSYIRKTNRGKLIEPLSIAEVLPSKSIQKCLHLAKTGPASITLDDYGATEWAFIISGDKKIIFNFDSTAGRRFVTEISGLFRSTSRFWDFAATVNWIPAERRNN